MDTIIVDMTLDPTRRFSSRVDAYVRCRPSYPDALLDLLERECNLGAGAAIADIGCGTGLLAQLFLARGCEVHGVEPNPEMREAGCRFLAAEPRFHSVEGRAEATGLGAASVEFVTAGQAFHWFDPEPARAEFRRILKLGGWVVLVWNERRMESGFMAEYETLIERYAPEKSRIDPEAIARFLGVGALPAVRFDNQQQLDAEGLRGRLMSSSYAPQPGTAESAELLAQVDELFARYRRQGLVTILYDTHVFRSRLG